jgi:acetyl-CoA carboxylase carboxyl transferase subunit alpha
MTNDAEIRLRDRLSKLGGLDLLRGARLSGELERLKRQIDRIEAEPTDEEIWTKVELARHEERPYTLDYVERLFDDWFELHGDRGRADDVALVAGIGKLDGRTVALIGHQKGRDIKERTKRNFGMAYPEGYRKAMRVMELAERFGLPVVTFVDVPGAHPGPESEERGIAEAIARSIGVMSRLRTPIVVVITGEGGSGGALAIAVGDVVIALENAVYSVISPEGCAAILWRTADEAAAAAVAMRMTAPEQAALGVVDLVVPEPGEGAHTDVAETARRIRDIVIAQLDLLSDVPLDALVEARYRRFRTLGTYREVEAPMPPPPERPGLADRLRNLLDSGRWSGISTSPTGRHDEPPARDEV